MKQKILKFISRFRYPLIAALVCALLAAWALFVEPNRLVLTRAKLEIPHWAAVNDGFRIVVISDLHPLPDWAHNGRLKRITDLANAQKPDVVLLVGDLVNAMGGEKGNITMPELTAFARDLKPKYGVFAVHGNHEFWYGTDKVEKALTDAGVTMLENKSATIKVNREKINFAGLPELSTTNHTDVVKALRQVKKDESVFLITHNPESLPLVPTRVSLTICGHTHGGQIRLPFLGSALMPRIIKSRFEPGLNVVGERKMYLTSGIGGSPFRARFCCPPEVVLLEIYAPKSSDKTP